MKTITTLAGFVLGSGLWAMGCGAGADPCQQASDKIQTCLRSLDCDSFTDPDEKEDCVITKAAALSAMTNGTMPACEGSQKARAEALNKCTLDSAHLCSDCTEATKDPSTEAPANGAKAFDWNACYEGGGSDDGPFLVSGCFHQWGSYPAACTKLEDEKYARGKKCKNVCNTDACDPGCFKNYQVGTSIDYLASNYTCSN